MTCIHTDYFTLFLLYIFSWRNSFLYDKYSYEEARYQSTNPCIVEQKMYIVLL